MSDEERIENEVSADTGSLAAEPQEPSREDLKAARKAAKAAKKAERARIKAKKKAKKKKPILPIGSRPLICPPEASDSSAKSGAVGMILRAVVIFFAVFGMSFLVTDALGFFKEDEGAVRSGFLALASLVWVALLTLSAAVKTRRVAIPLTVVAALGGAAAVAVNWTAVFRGTVNGIVTRMYSYGYLSIIKYKQPSEYGDMGLHGAVTLAAGVLVAVYAFAYVPFLVRRTRPVVPVIVTVATLVPVFVYNLTRSNWGVAMIIAAFSGAIVMCAFDAVYQREPSPDEYDTETCVFEAEAPVGEPEEATSRERRRAEAKARRDARRAAKNAERAVRKRLRSGKVPVSADEDISDYFAAPKKRSAKAEKPKKVKKTRLTKAERAAKKKADRAARAEERRRDREIIAARRLAREGRLSRSLTRASAGGYAGAVAFAAAMLILFIPTVTTNDSFRLIDAIDSKIDYYREYVTAFLMGDDPILDELAYSASRQSFEPRSTEAKHLSYTGASVMQVNTPSGSFPIYLRGWIATDYDRASSSWLTARTNSETFKNYRATFGTSMDPSESMFYGAYRYYDPESVADIDFAKGRYNSNSSYGFVSMQVNMKRLDLGGYLVYMPSYTNRRYSPTVTISTGRDVNVMRSWGGSDATKLSYINFFDGIYTGYRFAKDKDGYASVAYITSMKNTYFYRNVAEAIVTVNHDRMLIERDRAEKADSLKRYGTEQSFAGVFKTESVGDGRYNVTMNGEPFYSVYYNTVDERIEITVPSDVCDYIYYYSINDNKFLSKKAERKLADYPHYVSTPDLSPLIRYLELFTEAERDEFIQYWRVSDYYTRYVYDTYVTKPESTVIRDLVKKIISEAHTLVMDVSSVPEYSKGPVVISMDLSRAAESCSYAATEWSQFTLASAVEDVEVYEQRHKLVMEFIKWLKENCSYTLTPTLSDAEGLDGVEKFLTVTHEGYCVQFASSLVLMLREAGIPARYVEGYIASDFHRTGEGMGYTATVRDKNAHAWVEVWYDGIGWMQYEATPEYYTGMYEYGSSDPTPVTPVGPGRTDGDDVEPDDDPGMTDEELAELLRRQEEAERRKRIVKIVVIVSVTVAVVCILTVAAVIIKRRAARRTAEREELLRKLADAGRGGAQLEQAERRALVLRYSDMLAALLAECGCAPNDGEFREDYAGRVFGELGEYLRMPSEAERTRSEQQQGPMTRRGFGKCLDTIAAVEFGGENVTVDDAALHELEKLWRRLEGNAAHDRIGTWRRFVLKYFGN